MPPQAQNTEKTIESFATGTQYKMTMRVSQTACSVVK